MAHEARYDDESDADDEYERSIITSPSIPLGYYGEEETDSDHTTSGTPIASAYTIPIDQWTVDQCADFLSDLGLERYAATFVSENVEGIALKSLNHAHLKEMGISSVGHRLSILKEVYEIKLQHNVPIEPDDYVPPSADANAPDAHATQDDVARIINQIKLRDARIMEAEADLRSLREELWRFQEEQRKLREETLPLIRLAKDKSAPLPTPDALERGNPLSPVEASQSASSQNNNHLSRKFSKAGLNIGGKIPSPTIYEGSGLEASAAAVAASNHLTASMTSNQSSPRLGQDPSPTSPQYSHNSTASRSFNDRGAWAESEQQQQSQNRPQASIPTRRHNTISLMNPINTQLAQPGRDPTRLASPQAIQHQQQQQQGGAVTTPSSEHGNESGHPLREKKSGPPEPADVMKSFRVGMEEPCHRVLPQALKKYNLKDDWRLYSLYIVHGDQERCLGLEERPLILFKQLANEGKKPMFMLRKHASPAVGSVRTVDRSGAGGQQMGGSSSNGANGGIVLPALGPGGPSGGLGQQATGQRVQSFMSTSTLPGGLL